MSGNEQRQISFAKGVIEQNIRNLSMEDIENYALENVLDFGTTTELLSKKEASLEKNNSSESVEGTGSFNKFSYTTDPEQYIKKFALNNIPEEKRNDIKNIAEKLNDAFISAFNHLRNDMNIALGKMDNVTDGDKKKFIEKYKKVINEKELKILDI